jgi:polar amino acid transport system ATP-binding protein
MEDSTKHTIPADETDYIIDARGIHKYFRGNHILKGIDFQVKPGELISIIGRSGCGKTTLLRCLNCLEIFDSGTIRIAGLTLTRSNPSAPPGKEFVKNAKNLQKKVGMPFSGWSSKPSIDEDFQIKAHTLRTRVGLLFQNLNLFPHLTVLENVIKAPMIVKGESRQQSTLRAVQLLEKVGLEKYIDRYPYQLSGGQAQRVAIARALAMNPQVMLYDEPTSALDPELVEEVLTVMRNLNAEGMTQVIVTHAMNFARTASDYIVYMEEGKIIEKDHPDVIFNNPKDPRTANYLSIVKD